MNSSALPCPTSESLTRQRRGAVQDFYVASDVDPWPMIDHGTDIYLWDTAGNQYIDASSGPVVSNLGHSNQRVFAAMTEQVSKVAYASRAFFENQANIDLAELLGRLAGPGLERAFFVSGGSEATESAIKLARQYMCSQSQASRWKVLSLNPSYHGATLGAVAISGDPVSDKLFGPMITKMPRVPAPFTYRIPDGHTVDSYADYCADALEKTILDEGPETILAFFVEPVGGLATGALVAQAHYYSRIREICTKYGVLLVYDEVMSGAGRTGTFLAADHWPGVRPDIVTLAKGLGAGYMPLGAVLASEKIVDAVAQMGGFMHGFTYASNPLSCAVGFAAVSELVDNKLMDNAARMGLHLRQRLEELQQQSPILGDVRGKGLLMAIELVSDKDKKTTFSAETRAIPRITQLGMKHGLLLYSRRTANGQFGEWLMIAPPLIVNEGQIDEISNRLADTLSAFQTDLGK